MHKIYDIWPKLAKEAYESDLDPLGSKVTHFVFAGMGGSGAISDIFASILSKTDIHVDIVKGYHLPKTSNSSSLVVATSISGNTAETISVLQQAKEKNCKIIAFSNGGKMQDFCTKYSIDHRHISMKHSPRASFTIFLYSILKVLLPILPLQKNEVTESINTLEFLQGDISSGNISEKNPSLSLASWIDKFPLIYYPWGLQAAAVRFKNSIQENTKNHAMIEDVIETSHNGIMALSHNPSDVKPILLRGVDDNFKTKERWEILKEFFLEKNIEYREVMSVNGSILTKLIHLIYLLDYSTIYRAAILGIDPTPVDAINFVKKRMK
ncbi:MAG: SIS domain-containing protein [Nitrosopumilaceae archaeon]|nr:SIS domain-containing protein [Nitrosopumilaceae archaeon]NIU01397.1 SIS domain-containing protein [Nitrosopumilaceae archaeon]NIU87755.1 SIS domain-containing protein [Nitrosopumilaceae archaeon]NIV66133.1 SIS domain-containing protein [Nitrosopumilaceae archaeon]NIX61999.1 SIS domain-containing protein [Nitrosopumilaceae archaeon]